MAQANDAQMQQFANERMRVRAEGARSFFASLRDDKTAIPDIYERANGGAAWNDNRTDGPPRLLVSQDMLVYNAVISNLINILDGEESGTEQEIANQRAAIVAGIRDNWAVFQSMCVRPVEA